MRFVSYLNGDRPSYGRLSGQEIIDLFSPESPSLREAIAREGIEGLVQRAQRGEGQVLQCSRVKAQCPIPNPDKILCVGLNYHKHAKEVNMPVPVQPSIFVRFPSSLVADGEPVWLPRESEQLDFEAELAIVMGKRGRRIAEADAWSYVAGASCLAENSIRDWQRHSTQATPGKNFMHSGAFGPSLVTLDEIDGLDTLRVVGRLNEQVVQDDTVDQMIFTVPYIISYLSQFTELLPGDVISTGTPAGVGLSRKPQLWMKEGDVFEVEIGNLGTLRNPVVYEPN